MFPLERVSRSAPFCFRHLLRADGGGQRVMAGKPYDHALNLLAARAYTTRDMRRKLVQKKFEPAEVSAAIDRLLESGLLNDEKYAAEFARQRLVVSGASKRRIEQQLAQKGISRDVAAAATEHVTQDEEVDTLATIERLARKKLQSMSDLEPLARRRRVFGFLARKGYEIDEINSVLSRIIP